MSSRARSLSTSSMSGMPNRCAAARAAGRLCSRHSGQLHARHLGKLLKGVKPETAAADDAQADFSRIHGHSVSDLSFVPEVCSIPITTDSVIVTLRSSWVNSRSPHISVSFEIGRRIGG